MKILALDTVTAACSVALQVDDNIINEHIVQPQGHSELILQMIKRLLDQAGLTPGQLDAVAFGRGPGSFTGVRIGAAVTQGLAWAVDIPVIPVSSLATIAQGIIAEQQAQQVMVAMDARMNEVYWGVYRQQAEGLQLIGDELVCPPQATPEPPAGEYFGAGDGWQAYAEALQQRHQSRLQNIVADALPDARHMLSIAASDWRNGKAVAADQALPVYLRDDVAKKSTKR